MDATLTLPAPRGRSEGPLTGAANVFRKELREWFRTKKFLSTVVIMTLMLSAVPVIAFLHEGGLHDGRIAYSPDTYRDLMNAWVALTLTLGAYVVVALTMGVIVKEEDHGTAQWVFTKPVSRTGYVLAKFAANAIAVVAGGVVMPGVAFLLLLAATSSTGIQTWVGAFEALGLASLQAIIVLAVIIGLSAYFRNIAPIAGIAIGMNFIPLLFTDVVTWKVMGFFPVEIGSAATHLASGSTINRMVGADPRLWWQPVVCGSILGIVALIIACYRMERRQLQ